MSRYKNSFLGLIFLLSSLSGEATMAASTGPLDSLSLSPSVIQFIKWNKETNQKDESILQNKPYVLSLEHYEIPLSLIEQDNGLEELAPDPNILKALTAHGNLCWPRDPNDTHYYKKVEKFLEKHGIDPQKALKTGAFYASLENDRHFYMINPSNGYIWSVRMFVEHEGVLNKLNKGNKHQAGLIRKLSDHIQKVKKSLFNKRLFFMNPLKTTMHFRIADIDQSFIVEEFPQEFIRGEKYYLPGNTALSQIEGEKLARAHSETPNIYWRNNYNLPLARALGELAGLTGLTYHSPTPEKGLIELDKQMNPTGRIVLRDFSDMYLFERYFHPELFEHQKKIIKWTPENRKGKRFKVAFASFQNLIMPSWMFSQSELAQMSHIIKSKDLFNIPQNSQQLVQWNLLSAKDRKLYTKEAGLKAKEWGNLFLHDFNTTFNKITQIQLAAIKHRGSASDSGNFDSLLIRTYLFSHTSVKSGVTGLIQGRDGRGDIIYKQSYFKSYVDFTPCFQGGEKSLSGRLCQDDLFNIYGNMLAHRKHFLKKYHGLDVDNLPESSLY